MEHTTKTDVNNFRRAVRQKSKARIAFTGPSGVGKTYSAIKVAQGLGNKIALIATENEAADLYADHFTYDVLEIKPPYEPEKFIAAIKLAEGKGYDVVIIDTLTHEWSGEGGLIDIHGKIVDSGKMSSYSAWRTVMPRHAALINTLHESKCHIIATIRCKAIYVQPNGNDNGNGNNIGIKSEVKRIGIEIQQKEGIEYEFTTVFSLDQNHIASVIKDRSTLFDGKYFIPTEETGKIIKAWLDTGKDNTTDNTTNENETNESKTIPTNFILENNNQTEKHTEEEEKSKKFCDILNSSAKNLTELQRAWERIQLTEDYKNLSNEDKNKVRECKNELKKRFTHTYHA